MVVPDSHSIQAILAELHPIRKARCEFLAQVDREILWHYRDHAGEKDARWMFLTSEPNLDALRIKADS